MLTEQEKSCKSLKFILNVKKQGYRNPVSLHRFRKF